MKVKTKSKASTAIPASAMSDIAFLLIIFFMITTVFNKEQGLDIALPEATKPKVLEQTVIHVAIEKGSDGSIIALEGKLIALEQLSALIMAERMRKPNTYVVLKADESIPYSVIKKILDRIQEGYVNKVALAVDYKKVRK